ncbi:ATP-binding cassette domain-containing protein [Streptomyces genisteinicus]|uniref:ABC-type xenobiotic transporter n=1 Tax=Streptomyces genisteinicus TaxID=2768068 RepID=A0A7H0HTW8_9ACTN|nr:ATP-binding cassette domain-containing protein [Streptomyces genisteinicus]QNP63984.1 ATP-binding cassette domain-containing protein [Streptomyces genisteinicus]
MTQQPQPPPTARHRSSGPTAASAPSAIEAEGLRKSYGRVQVLDGIGLRVARGTVFALLGPNGAGKTTTVRVLATLTAADAGTARVAGRDVVTERSLVRRAISLTGQFATVDEKQTGEENLRMMGRLCGLSRPAAGRRAAELLERFGLAHAGGRLVHTYSGGMRRRLDLAAGLVGGPEVVFLDEPTTGLDPRSRQELWQVVRELTGGGTTVLLTTQYLEEADRLADRIAVMDSGRIVAEGTAAELKAGVGGHRIDVVFADTAAYLRHASRAAVHRSPETLTVGLPTDGSAARVRALLDEIDPGRTDVVRFSLHTTTLDDVFLSLTGEGDAERPHRATASAPDGGRPAHRTESTRV